MFNTVEITPNESKEVIEFCHQLNSPLLLLGRPGVGKTETVKEYAEKHNLRFIDIRLSLKDRGDFVIPFINQETETVKSYLTNLIPFDDVPTLIFFDELTNAPSEIQKMIFSIVLERTLEGRKLHPNTYVLAAGNTIEDGCNVYEVDPALIDRFTVIKIKHDIQGFIERALQKEAAPEVITFLKLKPDYLYGPFKDDQLPENAYLYCTPRSWMEISSFLKKGANKKLQGTLIPGRIGTAAYAEFRHVIDEMGSLPPIEEFFAAKTEKQLLQLLAPIKSLNALYGLAYSVLPYCTTEETYLQAIKIFCCLTKIQDNLPRPRNEIQAMAMELLLDKPIKQENYEIIQTLMSSPDYEQYLEERKELEELVKNA